MSQNVYHISVLDAIRTMDRIVTPIQHRWIMRLNWDRSPEWVANSLIQAAHGTDSLPYSEAVAILFQASSPTLFGGPNRGMVRIRDAWKPLKLLRDDRTLKNFDDRR